MGDIRRLITKTYYGNKGEGFIVNFPRNTDLVMFHFSLANPLIDILYIPSKNVNIGGYFVWRDSSMGKRYTVIVKEYSTP